MDRSKCAAFIVITALIVLNITGIYADDKTGNIIENSLNMRLVRISAGEFIMGSPVDEKGHQEDEFQHKVIFTDPFYIGITEVTQAQWKSVMGTNRSNFKGDDLPAEKLSWKEALLFCRKLSELEGRTYRLPTEAEWEYACRGGSSGPYADSSNNPDQIAWYSNNSGNNTHPVGQMKPNAWGIYDMHGNVSEWCQDYYIPEYPDEEAVDQPGPGEGKYRVIRGGAWDSFPVGCRSSARSSAPASYQFKQTGFRVVLENEH